MRKRRRQFEENICRLVFFRKITAYRFASRAPLVFSIISLFGDEMLDAILYSIYGILRIWDFRFRHSVCSEIKR